MCHVRIQPSSCHRKCHARCCCCLQIMVAAATTCVAVWLSQYCGAKHSFTVATVGMVTVAAYGICCAFLTMHDQASYIAAACFTCWAPLRPNPSLLSLLQKCRHACTASLQVSSVVCMIILAKYGKIWHQTCQYDIICCSAACIASDRATPFRWDSQVVAGSSY